ncbi:MAG: TetR/AcrR family transcriptional regulator [Actinomycetota bacterium]
MTAVKTRKARPSLSRRRVLEAALAIADTEGLDALTMRRLGSDLGVDPMSVYNYVDGKDSLLDGLVELLWEEVFPPAADSDWSQGLRGFAQSLRQVFHRHPQAAPLLLGRNVFPLPALHLFHQHLGALESAGFDAPKATEAIRTLVSYGIGYGLAELTCLGVPGTRGMKERPSERELLLSLGQALPPGTPPHLADAAVAVYTQCDAEECFESGLQLILEGLKASTSSSAGLKYGGRRGRVRRR